MKNKIIIGLATTVLILCSWYVFSTQKQTEKTTKAEVTRVKMGDLSIIHGLPFYVATEKGYFKEEGVEVERIKFEAPNQIVDALLSGSIDFGSPTVALGITGIANHKNPGKIKVYMVNGEKGEHSGENLVVPTNSNITNISDLRGKKLGILAGTIQWKTITREILAQNGLNMDTDLTIVELAGSIQVQTLASGQIDALLALEPIPTIAIGRGVAKIMIKSPAKQFIADPFWYGTGVVRADFATQNPNTTKKVIKALARATDEINQNPKAYQQYLKGYTALTDDLIASVPTIDFKMVGNLNDTDRTSINKFFNIFTKYNIVDGQIDFEKMIYRP